VGVWVAKLPGDAKVTLNLRADNEFRWTAESGNSASTFAGTYRLENDELSLNRFQDSKDLTGSWKFESSSTANFQLDQEQAGGLDFQKQ